MNQIEILKEPSKNKPFLIINKPAGLASAPLENSLEPNATEQAASLFPELKNVEGRKKIEGGLLHRLDTATQGLLIIAANQECYDFLEQEQKNERIQKFYTAKCHFNPKNAELLGSFPPALNDFFCTENQLKPGAKITVSSYFRHFGPGKKEVRPVTEECGKEQLKKIGKQKLYTSEITIKSVEKEGCVVECRITNGFKHQVRCHLAWAGLPVENDLLYNWEAKKKTDFANQNQNEIQKTDSDKKNAENPMKFSATKIIFEYPKGDLNSYEIAFTWT